MNPAAGKSSSFSGIISSLYQRVFLKNSFAIEVILIPSDSLLPGQCRTVFPEIVQFSFDCPPSRQTLPGFRMKIEQLPFDRHQTFGFFSLLLIKYFSRL